MKTLSKNEMRAMVQSLIANGAAVHSFAKFARIQAVCAKGGEIIETILAAGTKETSNVANCGDWIVTNPGGEKYIVPAAKFPKKYEAAPELGEGWYKPTGGVQQFLELSEDVSFVCSWDEEQFIAAGGMVNVSNLDDIYGIAKDEFYSTYKKCDAEGNFSN